VNRKKNNFEENILIAGAGGQGVMLLGRIIAEAAMLEAKNVTYIRSYGAEMRGGTSNCWIRISPARIAAPIFDKATISVMMNQPSLKKFKNRCGGNGVLLLNSSLIPDKIHQQGVSVKRIPLNNLALKLGNAKIVNIILLGFLLKTKPFVKMSSVESVIRKIFKDRPDLFQINLRAFKAGFTYG